MLNARFSHLYFCQSLYTLQRGLPAIAGLGLLVNLHGGGFLNVAEKGRIESVIKKASATATYQTILKMHILLLKVWNQNCLTAFGTTPTMFFISYYLLKKRHTL